MLSHEIRKNFKNTYFEEHLRKTASICFTSKWGRVWARRDLDRMQIKYFLNVTILFDQMQPYKKNKKKVKEIFFNISTILMKFWTVNAF